MKNIKSIVATLALGLTFAGSAAHASSFIENTDCNGCDQAPVPAGLTENPFSLEFAMSAFSKGAEPVISELAGTWINVGTATVAGQPDPKIKSEYDDNGVKNEDQSLRRSLHFQLGGNTGKTDFAGDPITAPDSVTLLNLGVKDGNQGPNELILSDRAQEACFAQYQYRDGSQIKSHSNYECRLLQANSKKMICSVTLILDSSDAPFASEDSAWNGKVEEYLAYVKQ